MRILVVAILCAVVTGHRAPGAGPVTTDGGIVSLAGVCRSVGYTIHGHLGDPASYTPPLQSVYVPIVQR
jgi:hypothetical protein